MKSRKAIKKKDKSYSFSIESQISSYLVTIDLRFPHETKMACPIVLKPALRLFARCWMWTPYT